MKVIEKVLPVLIVIATCSCSEFKSGIATRPGTDDGDMDGNMETTKVGEQLAPWTEGTLDIHFINTGRGECTFYVMPDGTTMLVDMAGSTLTSQEAGSSMPTPARPDASMTSAEVITGYIRQFTSTQSEGHIDYAVLTHFHEDHMGTYRASLESGGDGTFHMTSLAEIGTILPYRHYLDRGWPEYDYPEKLSGNKYDNLKNFLRWTIDKNGTLAERFRAGSATQIVLQYEPDRYPAFQVRNISSGGRFWTGKGEESEMKMPEHYSSHEEIPDENCFSCSFIMRFGAFDFYSGGDLQYQGRSSYPYMDSEKPVAEIAGETDVAKADHHGTSNCNGITLMKALRPSVWISHVWRDVQPNSATVGNVLKANPSCDIFLTNLSEKNKTEVATAANDRLKSAQGHVVIRVNGTGSCYMIYVLDDSDMNFKVKSIHGPYSCK